MKAIAPSTTPPRRIIRKRWLLMALLTTGQVGCFIVGVVWVVAWSENKLIARLEEQVSQEHERLAGQLSVALGAGALRQGVDWDKAKDILNAIPLPDEWEIRLLDARGGGRVERTAPSSTSSPPHEALTKGLSSVDVLQQNVPRKEWVVVDGQRHLLTRQSIPGSDAVIMIRQSEHGLADSIRRMIGPLRSLAVLATGTLLVLSLLLNWMILDRYENRVASLNDRLSELVERRSRALMKTRDAVIFGLAKLAESRDDDTGEHLERIRDYVRLLAHELAADQPSLDEEGIRLLCLASSLHDIGKVGIPDAVLLKPGPLTPSEMAIMRQHTIIGGECLLEIERHLGEDDFLEIAREIALAHHERWDGSGYPYGISREDIPLGARIVALADVYDALTSQRPYKPAFSHDQAKGMIIAADGKHFDPSIVRAFLAKESEFLRISQRRGTTKVVETTFSARSGEILPAVELEPVV